MPLNKENKPNQTFSTPNTHWVPAIPLMILVNNSTKYISTNEKRLQVKVLDTTAAEQVYNPEKYQIMNTKSFMWCAESSDRNVTNQL